MIVGVTHSKPLIAIGLRACLSGTPDMIVVTADARASNALDILLLDSSLAGDWPALDDLRDAVRRSPVLVLVPDGLGPTDRDPFLDAGATGCIDYAAQPGEIVDQVRAASVSAGTPSLKGGPGLDTLSPQEITALSYIARGYTHAQAARRMEISRHTVDTYIKRARAKLQLGNKAELTRALLSGAAWAEASA